MNNVAFFHYLLFLVFGAGLLTWLAKNLKIAPFNYSAPSRTISNDIQTLNDSPLACLDLGTSAADTR